MIRVLDLVVLDRMTPEHEARIRLQNWLLRAFRGRM